ncbi:uncharacterized protein CIMG_05503 [Coccidioides immitis RS]|uniref:AB hydrolase-1 domain-containing protein n=4 Tax=Coccidioides immitis TaxID=5501 RepID=J3KFQ8_COCIM|nr:uncharacterized protein CIMG_05503 [Coccidioides immitis RS]KMP05634.1 hypothetical protein CIRG_05315 [Coccidioides immitis RMSCC 2394]KMU74366.1 hypothetical protein CISG_04439 [Coccidioides immitis RMSCC 3703]KMU86864.1 hypothetical protein CIHG_04804 [Coccidioides immitis H538.4]TPX21913.1 hypothetical protein DIZ76_015878 [Coccidioides immitis]EAS34479.3 hypothetical protein CIMG_05503 [Coccidioides immitis RS]
MADLIAGEHHFAAPNGLDFTYTVRCSEQSVNSLPVLVQCPGWGIGSRYLEVGLSPLEKHFKFIYFHPRGTAGSSRPDDPTEMSCFDMARDLELFRIYLRFDRYPALLGHSHGGAIALAYAQLFPEKVTKIILIDHRLIGFDDSSASRRFKRDRKGDSRYDKAYKMQDTASPTTDSEFTELFHEMAPIYFYDPEAHIPAFFAALGPDQISLWCVQKVNAAEKRVKREATMIKGLKRVTAQTLIIFGNQDAQCTIENLEQTKSGIHSATGIVLDECGHFPWIEKREETFTAVRAFLEAE